MAIAPAEVPAGLPELTGGPLVPRQRLAEEDHGGDKDRGAGRREQEEQAAPVGDGGELPAEHGPDDRGETADHGQAAVVPHERAAGVEIAARGLRDHDADRAGEPLCEAGGDQCLDAGTDRAQHRGDDVRGDTDQQRASAAEPVRKRTGGDLAERKTEQAGRDRQLRGRGGRPQVAGQGGQDREVQIHRDRPEDGQQREDDGQGAADRPLARRARDHGRGHRTPIEEKRFGSRRGTIGALAGGKPRRSQEDRVPPRSGSHPRSVYGRYMPDGPYVR